MSEAHREHLPHVADIGLRGVGRCKAEAFEQAAIALTAVITDPQSISGTVAVEVECAAADEFLPRMVAAAPQFGIELPDRELACAPNHSPMGEAYLGAMRAAINCALANRQILTHLVREEFGQIFPKAELPLLYDVSHNTCKTEEHVVNDKPMRLFVHRKGATRAFGPGHPAIPDALRKAGQPVLIGGTMGTASYYIVQHEGRHEPRLRFGCHGAGRSMSRHQALRPERAHPQPLHARRCRRSSGGI